MVNLSPVNSALIFRYVSLVGKEDSSAVAEVIVTETRSAPSRSSLSDATPEYGFRVIDGQGNVVAEIEPGWFPFVRKVIEKTAEEHSPACQEDCNTPMNDVIVRIKS